MTSIDLPFTKRTLANGLDVIVHEDHHVPIVAVNIWYHVGSKNERPGRTGFAHLFEHLMFEGSQHHNSGFFPPLQQAGAQGRVIVVDGFITTAAVAVAAALQPALLQRCVFAHRSQETGHARWLQQLDAAPLLDLELRLGEGSGAALAWPLLESACRVLDEMASFESAGVSRRTT